MILALLVSIASVAGAISPDAPFHLRAMQDQKDVGAINENFRALSDYMRYVEDSATTGAITASGDNAFTGSNSHAGAESFTSSVTIGGNIFQGSSPLFISSCTTNMAQTNYLAAAFQTSVTGSTLTHTTGGHALVTFNGMVFNSAATTCGFNILVDGNFYAPWSATNGINAMYAANTGVPLSMSVVLTLSPGSHTFSFMGSNPVVNGSCNVPYTAAAYPNTAQFCVFSLP